MANPLFAQFGNTQENSFFRQLMAEARNLEKTMQNPRAMVEQLMQSGQMSQNDFQNLSRIANQIVKKY